MDDRFLDLDRHGVLRPPLVLWFIGAFLLRHWLLMLFIAASARASPATLGWFDAASTAVMLTIELPMALLAFAWSRRLPDAGAAVRWLWRQGRWLIGLTAALNLGWAVWYLAGQSVWNPWPERAVALAALADAAIIVGTWRSPVLRQLFLEFPPRPSPKGAPP